MLPIICLIAAVAFMGLTAVFLYLQITKFELYMKKELSGVLKEIKTINSLHRIAINKAVDKIINRLDANDA